MNKERISLNMMPEPNIWQDKELLSSVAVYNFDSFLKNLAEFKISYTGMGYFGIVFRVQDQFQNTDIALKIMRFKTRIKSADVGALFRISGILFPERLTKYLLLTDYRHRPAENTKDLTLLQVAGHMLGNEVVPQYIDAPVCLWVKKTYYSYEAVGYSLPYVQGEKIRICKDSELTAVADNLESQYNLFVGARGKTLIRGSKNAIVSYTGQKKFIDVRLKDPKNYSFPKSVNC